MTQIGEETAVEGSAVERSGEKTAVAGHPVRSTTARTIAISEIFGPTIQGEGALIGKPTVFVRTGGCDYRCSWCDTGRGGGAP